MTLAVSLAFTTLARLTFRLQRLLCGGAHSGADVRAQKLQRMNEFSGSFDGEIVSQTTVGMTDVADHAFNLAQVVGQQNSTDAKWNGAGLSYWGIADLVEGSGSQRGYFVNTAENGDRNWGTFDGSITTSGDQTTLDGVWQFTGGTGAFDGVVGNGTYRGKAVSLTSLKMEWEGQYKL